MSRYLQNKTVMSIITTFIVMCSVPTRYAGAQFGGAGGVLQPARIQQGDYGYDPRSGQPRQRMDPRQQAQQQIQTAAQEMDQMLVKILEMVNQQLAPRPEMLDQSKRVVTAAKKYAKRYSNALKCEILMLQSWNGYFTDDMPTAMMAASAAYKINSSS